jgi:hypothetical protein
LGLVRGSAGDIEEPSLVGPVPPPERLGDVCAYRISGAKELRANGPLIKSRPSRNHCVELVGERNRALVGD